VLYYSLEVQGGSPTWLKEWKENHADATLEETAAAWRKSPMKVALEVPGKRERKDKAGLQHTQERADGACQKARSLGS